MPANILLFCVLVASPYLYGQLQEPLQDSTAKQILSNKVENLNLANLSYFSYNDSASTSLQALLATDKYIYIEIWSIYCSPCYKSFSSLNKMQSKYADQLTILTLLNDGTYEDLQRISKEYQNQFLQGFSNEAINTTLQPNGYPSGFLFNEKGILIKRMHPKELKELFPIE